MIQMYHLGITYEHYFLHPGERYSAFGAHLRESGIHPNKLIILRQGDLTTITGKALINNKGYGIYLYGEGLGGGRYFPGEQAVNEDNFVDDIFFQKNKQGSMGDFSGGNIIQ